MHHKFSNLLLLAIAWTALVLVLAPVPARAQAAGRGGRMMRNDGTSLKVTSSRAQFTPSRRPTRKPPKPRLVESKNLPPITLNGIESVIGDDGRVQVTDTAGYPNSAVVYLEVNFPFGEGSCSGWMVGPHTIATAGHCVYLGSLGGWATSITAYPGRNAALAPFGSFPASHWFIKKKWSRKEKPKFDFAAINIPSDIAQTVGTFGFAYNDDDTFWQEYPVTVRGYPGDKPAATMWTMNGTIDQIVTTRFFYAIDTAAGQSGSPLYGRWGSECDPCGFGIHTYGVGGSWTLNSATRITNQVFNFLNSAIAQ